MTNTTKNPEQSETLQNHHEKHDEDVIGASEIQYGLDDRLPTLNESHHDGYASIGSVATTIDIGQPDNIISQAPETTIHYRKQLGRIPEVGAPKSTPANLRPTSILSRSVSHATSMGGFSHRSDMEHLIPPPSTDKEKSKMTRRYLATVFAIMYAVFLVIFGAVVFILDVTVEQQVYPVGESFIIFMISVSFLYFLFLYVDIRYHVRKAKRTIRERERRQKLFEEHLNRMDGDLPASELFASGVVSEQFIMEHLKLPPLRAVSHKYCFMTGRHGEFFYLKFGAAWFALGLLIHSILQITYQVIFFSSEDTLLCASKIALAMDILFPIYSLFVLFFIFKYMNVIINENRGLARIMLMHAVGTSLAMWIYTIVTETFGAISIHLSDHEDLDPEDHICTRPDVMNFIHRNISPYLYPFIIEFCILIVGIFYMMWANISHCPRKFSALGHSDEEHMPNDMHEVNMEDGKMDHDVKLYKPSSSASQTSEDHCDPSEEHENHQYKSTLVVFADCHASSRGMFAGLLLVVVTIVFIILFFIAVQNDDYLYTGILVNNIFELVVLVIMIVAVIFAYFKTIKLDVNHHPMSKLDDILLFIAIPAFFLETIFSLIPAITNGSGLRIAIIFCQLVQILIQTPFIIDGLRRCSNAAHLRRDKPGRELVTFLIIANVSVWLFLTFSVKTFYTGDERYEFYGYILWNILNHISLPLIMFYRFHASVCLVDMWRHSYEPQPADH